jgi:TolA-binding protein
MRASTELHPEDLLDRDARGELGDAERQLLEAHLSRCAACRIERRARVDFRAEVEPPEGLGDPADVQPLLAKVLAMRPASVEPPRARRVSRGRRLLPLLVAAALVSAAAWAATAVRTGLHASAPPSTPLPSVPATTRAMPVTPSGPANAEPAPTPAATIAEVAAPAGPVTDAPRPAGAAMGGAERISFVTHAPTDPLSAGAAFDRANSARRSGDHRRAAELYRSLVARYPRTAEARASLVALGRMLLDDGDAAGALGSFDQYLASSGALAEDAMLGRALALRHLGRAGDEARAWSALVREYPGSVHAGRARQRLLELGTP